MNSDLQRFRLKLDKIDRSIIELLAERCDTARLIGAHKRAKQIPVEDINRESAMRQERKRLASQYKLDPDFVEAVFLLLMRESKRIQDL